MSTTITPHLSTDLNEGRQHARFLVDTYYQEQDRRKVLANQIQACEKSGEPCEHLQFILRRAIENERYISKELTGYASGHPVGQWSMGIIGIAGVLSSGLLAHVDIDLTPSVGALWRYAGLDPTNEWLGRKGAADLVSEIVGDDKKVTDEHLARIAGRLKRKLHLLIPMVQNKSGKIDKESLRRGLAKCPWNKGLKVLAWKIGESFKKQSGNEKSFYGQVYAKRKLYELEKNERGDYADQAALWLPRMSSTSKISIEAYKQGKLPNNHIVRRSQRYAAKLFLAHWWSVYYVIHHKVAPPRPYVFEFLENHTKYYGPPNFMTTRQEDGSLEYEIIPRPKDDVEDPTPQFPEQ